MLAGALLLANHASSGNVSSRAEQSRVDCALLLKCALLYAPELGRRIQEDDWIGPLRQRRTRDMLGGSRSF